MWTISISTTRKNQIFEAGHLNAGTAKIKVCSEQGNPVPRHFNDEIHAGGLGALFKDFTYDSVLIDLMPPEGIDHFIQDCVYHLWRGSDARRMPLSSWLSEWEQDGLFDVPPFSIEEFFASWWEELRAKNCMRTPQGRPYLTDLCASVFKLHHGNDYLSVSIFLLFFGLGFLFSFILFFSGMTFVL